MPSSLYQAMGHSTHEKRRDTPTGESNLRHDHATGTRPRTCGRAAPGRGDPGEPRIAQGQEEVGEITGPGFCRFFSFPLNRHNPSHLLNLAEEAAEKLNSCTKCRMNLHRAPMLQ
jgi:hypothetical protein